MVFDLDLIKKIYTELPGKIEAARKIVGKPLTLTEKILYCPSYRQYRQQSRMYEEKIMWILHRTG